MVSTKRFVLIAAIAMALPSLVAGSILLSVMIRCKLYGEIEVTRLTELEIAF